MAEKKEKVERKIVGSIAVAGYDRAFVAGDEDALEEAIANDTDKVIDVAHLTKSGALVGFGGEAMETVDVVNRQRNANGEQADAKGAKAAEGRAAESAKPRKTALKSATRGDKAERPKKVK